MRPAGVGRTTKDNSQKHPMQRDEWMEAKKIGRPKQRWVWDGPIELGWTTGHWEKIRG